MDKIWCHKGLLKAQQKSSDGILCVKQQLHSTEKLTI